MITFLEYLTEATAKKPPFQKTVKELHQKLYNANIEHLEMDYKPYFAKLDNEIATISYSVSIPLEGIELATAVEKTEETLVQALSVLGVKTPKIDILKQQHSTTSMKFKTVHDWTVEVDFSTILKTTGNYKKTFGKIHIIGPEVKASQEVFDKYPEIKPGAILVRTVSSSMTSVSFYKVKNRSGMIVNCVPLKQKMTDTWVSGGEVVPTSQELSGVYKGHITKNGAVEFEKFSGVAILWNGQPQTFTNID